MYSLISLISFCSSLSLGIIVSCDVFLMISISLLLSSSFVWRSMFSRMKMIAAADVKKTDAHGLLVML